MKNDDPLELKQHNTEFIERKFKELEKAYLKDDVSSRCTNPLLPPANYDAYPPADDNINTEN